mmetsp:Transcript_9449/g.19864  ORF Transcript_9449/g.19864 Transcript_9449/m.19864 type:complete len:1071 (-) Transcript_9449:110-3322(-)
MSHSPSSLQSSIDMSRLSIKEDGPNLTSRTPPPPGFNQSNGSNGAGGNTTGKSTSFNDLAMALGTGLAECMDDSTNENNNGNNGGNSSLQQQSFALSSDVDNYTRQSRHSVNRMVGSGGGGFDYLNPAGTSHFLIPPSDLSYLNKLKAEHAARLGDNGGGQQLQGMSGGGTESVDFLSNNNYSNDARDFNTSLQQAGLAMHQQQQQQTRITSSMMANSRDDQTMDSLRQYFQGNGNNSSDNINSSNNESGGSNLGPSSQNLTQELLRHHLWQHSNPSNNRSVGQNVTIVEPSSRGSPAPQMLLGLYGTGSNNFGNGQGQARDQGNAMSGGKDDLVGRGVLSFNGGRSSAPPSNSHAPAGALAGGLLGGTNNPAIRAYTASSLQMRVAELHQQLGASGGHGNIATLPTGNVVVLTPGATPVPLHSSAISREGTPDPLLHKHISRSSTPASTLTNPADFVDRRSGATPNLNQFQPSQEDDVQRSQKEQEAVEELKPFLRENKRDGNSSNSSSSASSRGLAILFASSLNVPDVRSTCEAFGALESFRSDFAETKGVYFATFYDLRSAQLAVEELPKALNQMSGMSGGKVEVNYCVPLNSSSVTDESMIFISNLQDTYDEQDLSQVLSSFGEIRSIHYQTNMSGDVSDLSSYLVEFYDTQDAKQALLELEHTNPWGEGVTLRVGTRTPKQRKQGKDLLVLMSCWRKGAPAKREGHTPSIEANQTAHIHAKSPIPPAPAPLSNFQQQEAAVAPAQQQRIQGQTNQQYQVSGSAQTQYQFAAQGDLNQFTTQLVLGPDGQYSYILVPNPQHHGTTHSGVPHFGHQIVQDPHQPQQQHLIYAPGVDQQFAMQGHQQYQIHYGNYPPPQYVRFSSDGVQLHPGGLPACIGGNRQNVPHTSSPTRASLGKSNVSVGSGGSSGENNTHEEDNNNLSLHIEHVRSGKDRRSSLMVRNIPNKYTQQMLLAEFAQAGHGSDKMDFFYLPIDFKNKCNRGYAFVNFVDYKDIVPFFDAYNGKSWKRFNSDKICDITYARIQGKAAMLKRFENSALMEKDDEYRPMVFVSHGERKGQIEAMPRTS